LAIQILDDWLSVICGLAATLGWFATLPIIHSTAGFVEKQASFGTTFVLPWTYFTPIGAQEMSYKPTTIE